LVKARTRRPPVAAAPADGEQPPPGISEVDRFLLRDQLRRALATIGREHRAAVVETILRDRPHHEVAADLGVPAGTVRSRVHYALRRLRLQLEAAEAAS
jgi:RNA polymerase sigma-70 factor (ECF subfamily)